MSVISLGSRCDREHARPIRVQQRLRKPDLARRKSSVVRLAPLVLHLRRGEADTSKPSCGFHCGPHLGRVVTTGLPHRPDDGQPLVVADPAAYAPLLAKAGVELQLQIPVLLVQRRLVLLVEEVRPDESKLVLLLN